MRRTVCCSVLSTLALTLAASARADLVYSAQPDYGQYAYYSYTGSFRELTSFTVAATSTVTRINWWGVYSSGGGSSPDTFTIREYDDNNGTPESTAALTLTATDLTPTDTGMTDTEGFEEYRYSATLSDPLTFVGGQRYYLSITDSHPLWGWQEDGTGTHYFGASPEEGTPWIVNGDGHQFSLELEGSVVATPEPSTLVLAASAGLVGLSYVRRHRRRRRVAG